MRAHHGATLIRVVPNVAQQLLPRVHADGCPDCLPHQVSALAAGASVALLLVPTHDLRRPHASAHASPAAAARGNQPDEGGNQPEEGGNQDGHQQERPLLAQPAPLPRPLLVRTDNIGVVQVGL